MSKLIGSFSLIWLLMAISTTAKFPAPVLDADGDPLVSGQIIYHILPATTDTAVGLTLINRNGSCPYYVGQEPLNTVVSQGLRIIFTTRDGDTIIREGRDFIIGFFSVPVCVQTASWKVGEENKKTSRRYISTTGGDYDYFNIVKNGGLYNIRWCPNCYRSNCPKPRCGDVGIVIEKGKRLLALDGAAFPFQFKKVN